MFRINAKNFFVTYPQIGDVTHQQIHDHLKTLADNVYSCLELHEDGHPHVHAIVSYNSKKDIRRPDYFDAAGRHPNIQACRNLSSSIAYLNKDGSTLGEPPGDARTSRAAAIQTLLIQSQTPDAFIRGFEEIDPLRSIIHHHAVESFAAKRYRRPDVYVPRPTSSFKTPSCLDRWVAENLFPSPERPKCLVLISPTRFGKTEWARSLGAHTYWNNYVTAERNLDARYAVIDDMERFSHFSGAKAIFGCQKVVGINPKYSHLQQWNWGIPTIWLFNQKPLEICPNSYYEQNATIIELSNPLF